jgi:hypothetical protein
MLSIKIVLAKYPLKGGSIVGIFFATSFRGSLKGV